MLKKILLVSLFFSHINLFAAEYTHSLNCEFYFKGLLMMTLKTDSMEFELVGEQSDVTFQQVQRDIYNIIEPLGENELFHFTLDEQQEKNLFVQIFNQNYENQEEGTFVSKITNPQMPVLNVFDGFCRREKK